jgi:AraC-like DNA-binding protein
MISAKEYLDRNYREDGCIENAADISGISRRRFNDLFKNDFGITPNRYVTKQKVEYAKQLLCLKELSVSEISEICGFSDIYYFSRQFKNYIGITPSQFVAKYKSSK